MLDKKLCLQYTKKQVIMKVMAGEFPKKLSLTHKLPIKHLHFGRKVNCS